MANANKKKAPLDWLPKAKGFHPRFKWSLIIFFLALVVAIIVVLNLSNPDTKVKHNDNDTATSDAALAHITANSAKKEPIILLPAWSILIKGQSYPVYEKAGVVYAKVGTTHVPLANGSVVYRNGKPYLYENGHLVPLNQTGANAALTGPQAGDIVERDGKLYQMGADGKLHPYHATLHPGQIVWKNGKPEVVGRDGKLHALGDKPRVGDFVEKDGKLYRVGADGKLHRYTGHLQAGDVLWKNGKAYVEGQDGQLHAVGAHPAVGDLVEKDGQLYQLGQDGKLHPYLGKLQQGQMVWKNGVPYRVGQDGKLHRVTNGVTRAINGKPYVWKNGHWVPLAANVGDIVDKDGTLYQVGKDGKLHLYRGKLRPGQIVWKDGKPYLVNANGELIPLSDGQSFTGVDGKQHQYKGGAILTLKPAPKKTATPAAGNDDQLEAAYKSALTAYTNHEAEKQSTKKKQGTDPRLAEMNALDARSKALSQQLLNVGNGYAQQNGQSAKVAFLKEANTEPDSATHPLQHPKSPYTLFAASFIPATLETGLNSDLPGQIIARVSENVFDTVTGNYLLIPQGTVIYGKYDSNVSYGQSRILMVFTRLLFPNGTSMDLDNLPGADLSGFAGLHDKVNNHYLRVFGSALMFAIFGAAGQLSQPNNNQNGPSNQQIVYAAVGQQMSQTSMQMVAKNMNIQPTINIRKGDNFNILTTRDMVFPHPYRFGR